MPNPYAPTERALGSLADRIERMMGARAGHKARMSEMEMAHTGTMAGLGLQKQRLGLTQERFAAERPGIEARTKASQIGLRTAEREEEKALEQEQRLNEPSEIFGNQQAFEETFGFFDTDVWNRVVTRSVPKEKYITAAQGNVVGLKITKKEAQQLSSVILPQIRTKDWEQVENASRTLMGTMNPKAPEYKQAEALNKTALEMLQYFTKTPGAREHRRRVRGDPLSKTEKQAADMFMQENFGQEFKMETMQGPGGQIMSYPIQKGVATAWPEGWTKPRKVETGEITLKEKRSYNQKRFTHMEGFSEKWADNNFPPEDPKEMNKYNLRKKLDENKELNRYDSSILGKEASRKQIKRRAVRSGVDETGQRIYANTYGEQFTDMACTKPYKAKRKGRGYTGSWK